MGYIRIFFVSALLLIGCKKVDSEPDIIIRPIVAKWKLEAYEKTVNGVRIWERVQDVKPSYVSFRSDGVILDTDGLPNCCSPGSYYINGTLFRIEPKSFVPVNPRCALLDCIGCSTWTMEQTGNELIISYCEPLKTRSKYIRM